MKLLFHRIINCNNKFYIIENAYSRMCIFDENYHLIDMLPLVTNQRIVNHFFSTPFFLNGYIVAFPCWGNEIVVFSTENNSIRYIDVSDICDNNLIPVRMSSDGGFYAYSYRKSKIVFYLIDIFHNTKKELCFINSLFSHNDSFANYTNTENKIYLFTFSPDNIIIEYDIRCNKVAYHHIDGFNIKSMYCAFGIVWILTDNGIIKTWDTEGNTYTVFDYRNHESCQDKYDYEYAYFIHDDSNIYVLGMYVDGTAIKIDPYLLSVELVWLGNISLVDSNYPSWNNGMYDVHCFNHTGIFLQRKNGEYYASNRIDDSFHSAIEVDFSVFMEGITINQYENEYLCLEDMIKKVKGI